MEKELKVINKNGVLLVDSRDVAEMTEKKHQHLMRDIRNLLIRNVEYKDEFIKSTYINSQRKTQPCYLMTEKGKEIILNKYKLRLHSASLEIPFIDLLENVLEPFEIVGIRQYNCLGYRIDYYIPSLKIAIEYDENGHNSYNYDRQQGRQSELEKELGCSFIRVTDKKSNEYNVGLVLKNIMTIYK